MVVFVGYLYLGGVLMKIFLKKEWDVFDGNEKGKEVKISAGEHLVQKIDNPFGHPDAQSRLRSNAGRGGGGCCPSFLFSKKERK